ncbi:MAG: RodZ domain-containing protein [bacterium]
MQTVGAYLRKNRELKGVSLEEIASSTKININILSYLESDKFDKLPASVFVKGFIRTYLRYLGVEPKEAILFYELISNSNKAIDDKINTLTEKEVCNPKEKINKRVLIASIVISVVFASLLTYYFATNNSSEKSKSKMIVKMLPEGKQVPLQPQGITINTAVAAPAATPTTSVTPAAPAQVQATAPASVPVVTSNNAVSTTPAPKSVSMQTQTPSPSPVTNPAQATPQTQTPPATGQAPSMIQKVLVRAKKDVWLKVQLDGASSFDFLLRSGNTKKLEAKSEIKLLIGDASAVTIDYDGQVISNIGKEGNTKTLVFPGFGRWKDAML